MKPVDFDKRFLESRDDSGRFIVTSFRTGKKYYIEPIGPDRAADWGSYNPSTGNIENKKIYSGTIKFQKMSSSY